MNVSQLMIRGVVTCAPHDSLETAACKMWDHDIGCLPVVSADGHVVGMITDRDACMAAYTQGRLLRDMQVKWVMAHPVFTCGPGDRIEDAEVVMRKHKVRRVPVVDSEGRVVGVISLNDLIREAAGELRRKHPDVAEDELVSTLACVCEPRRVPLLPFAAE